MKYFQIFEEIIHDVRNLTEKLYVLAKKLKMEVQKDIASMEIPPPVQKKYEPSNP